MGCLQKQAKKNLGKGSGKGVVSYSVLEFPHIISLVNSFASVSPTDKFSPRKNLEDREV